MGIAESGALRGKVAIITGAATASAGPAPCCSRRPARGWPWPTRVTRSWPGPSRRCGRPAGRCVDHRRPHHPEFCAAVVTETVRAFGAGGRAAEQRGRRHMVVWHGRDHHARAHGTWPRTSTCALCTWSAARRCRTCGRGRRHDRQHLIGLGLPRLGRARLTPTRHPRAPSSAYPHAMAASYGRCRNCMVNAICPGTIRTRLTADMVPGVRRPRRQGRGIPLGRVGEPRTSRAARCSWPPTTPRSSRALHIVADGGRWRPRVMRSAVAEA